MNPVMKVHELPRMGQNGCPVSAIEGIRQHRTVAEMHIVGLSLRERTAPWARKKNSLQDVVRTTGAF